MEEEREWKEGKKKEGEEEAMAVEEAQVDKLLVYKSILQLLQPGETVTKVTRAIYDVGLMPCVYCRHHQFSGRLATQCN